jgi:hypothetical protein
MDLIKRLFRRTTPIPDPLWADALDSMPFLACAI